MYLSELSHLPKLVVDILVLKINLFFGGTQCCSRDKFWVSAIIEVVCIFIVGGEVWVAALYSHLCEYITGGSMLLQFMFFVFFVIHFYCMNYGSNKNCKRRRVTTIKILKQTPESCELEPHLLQRNNSHVVFKRIGRGFMRESCCWHKNCTWYKVFNRFNQCWLQGSSNYKGAKLLSIICNITAMLH